MKNKFEIGAAAATVLILSTMAFGQADWTQRTPATSPSARYSPAMAQFGSYVLLFGGEGSTVQSIFDDTWLWDGTNWTKITGFGIFGTGPHPPARARASMAYDPDTNEVILFGGDSVNGALSDTWIFHQVTISSLRRTYYEWFQVSGDGPPPRNYGLMDYNPNIKRTILTGGEGAGLQRDTWELTTQGPDSPQWTKINTPDIVDPGRTNSAMAKCGGTVVLFGLLRQTAPQQLLEFGGYTGNTAGQGDSWELVGAPGTFDWSQLSLATQPSRRFSHGMAYYPVSNRVILYGGYTTDHANLFSDTWNGLCGGAPSWTQATPAHNPGPRENMGMATGPDGNTVVLFGGLKEGLQDEVHPNGETWTWGRRAACLPTDGSIISRGSEVRCQFDKIHGVEFDGWSADGFAPHEKKKLDQTFRARKKGTATITADWTDADGAHSMTYTYTVTKRDDRDDDDDDD